MIGTVHHSLHPSIAKDRQAELLRQSAQRRLAAHVRRPRRFGAGWPRTATIATEC